ncbi:P2Y purinoceptor 11-like [Amia ocellicauda]|uniref:P2Y purinoceptor 11-like n=1 Tax=Amia ocellicauda TaxID=2972642 RepID=UPI0034641BAB
MTILVARNDCSSGFDDVQIAYLPPVYGFECCVGFVCNVGAIFFLLTRERPDWHTGVIFSLNLAVCDLIYALTLPLPVVYYARGKHWIFGDPLCKVLRFVFTCNLYGSIFFITCISLNRYVAIVHPLFTNSHIKTKHAKVVSVCVWILILVICSPIAKFASTPVSSNRTHCETASGKDDEESYLSYSLFLTVFGCAVPFLATCASYYCILREVGRSHSISAQDKHKVALMVGAVVSLYFVSFIPYHVFRNVNQYLKVHDATRCNISVYNVYQVTKGLITLNMCVHPLLYASLMESCRARCCGGNPTA